ncbi:MAG: DNA gyrase inhibitor YacG [Bryobacteraceae bacterium]
MTCPICRREVDPRDPQMPFCSERCRMIDLGNWAAGKYRIPVALTPESEEEDEESHEK